MPVADRRCITDGHERRKAPHPGPRCRECWLKVSRERKARSHAQHVERTRGLTVDEYQALYSAQGGVCAICGPWTGRSGRSKNLAVDHDHRTGMVRGLLCSECNRQVGRWRDNPRVFERAARYLISPPSLSVLADRDWSRYR